MTVPTVPQAPAGQPLYPPPAPTVAPSKFTGLAVASLVLGIIGVVFSLVPFLNIITMLAAIVGGILGIVALFGTRRVMAGFGVALTILAIIITASWMNHLNAAVNPSGLPAPHVAAQEPASGPTAPPTARSVGSGTAPTSWVATSSPAPTGPPAPGRA